MDVNKENDEPVEISKTSQRKGKDGKNFRLGQRQIGRGHFD